MAFLAIVLFLPTIAFAVQAKEGERFCNTDSINSKYINQWGSGLQEWAIKIGEKCKPGDNIQFMENSVTVGYKIGLVCDLKRSVVLAQSSGIVVCSFAPHPYYKPTD